jgi:hypothetical protein
MMGSLWKNLKLRIYKDRFKQEGKTKYLFINKRYKHTDAFCIDGYFETREFSNKADAKKFLLNDVAKSDQADWKLYIETELTPQPTTLKEEK